MMSKGWLLCFFLIACFAGPAYACHYNEEEVRRDLETEIYRGRVEIIAVGPKASELSKPSVMYKILDPQGRKAGFTEGVITTEAEGAISSCDYGGPWVEGSTIYEIFFMRDGKPHASTVNMRAFDAEKFSE